MNTSPVLNFSRACLTVIDVRSPETGRSRILCPAFSPRTQRSSSILPRLADKRSECSANAASLCSRTAVARILAIALDWLSSKSILSLISFSDFNSQTTSERDFNHFFAWTTSRFRRNSSISCSRARSVYDQMQAAGYQHFLVRPILACLRHLPPIHFRP